MQGREADAVRSVAGRRSGCDLALEVIASAATSSDATALHEDARQRLGVLGRTAKIFNVYSAGDSGEGCEVIEFATESGGRLAAWTARVCLLDGRQFVSCTLGWE